MKNAALFTLAILLSLTFFASTANAQSTGRGNPTSVKTNWVDLNGDGKDGTGTQVRPQDGTGFGNKGGNATVSGVHDGTGNQGATAARRGRNK
ncbi:MAG: hypothetical protein FD122_926 [Stygiobacter sp.]|nr:MAG: hypothetical protein FD122_926 [Stygiobacter sp.]